MLPLTLVLLHRIKIDMTGNGIAGPTEPTPAPPTSTYKPYRQGIQQGKIDMQVFVNDLRTFWPTNNASASKSDASAVGSKRSVCFMWIVTLAALAYTIV